jgi:hypothetical protein
MIDAFEYWLYKSVFFAVLWLLLSPLCLAMMYVLDLLGGKDAPLFVRVPLIIGLLVALVGTHWVASTAAKKRVVERRAFDESLKGALVEARVLLSWLPLLGRLARDKRRSRGGD